MNDSTDQVEEIRRLHRLFRAQIEAYASYGRDPSRINYRRWIFAFDRYAALRNKLIKERAEMCGL